MLGADIYDIGRKRRKKLKIWGRAQREAARRRKSDWGTVKGLKFLEIFGTAFVN